MEHVLTMDLVISVIVLNISMGHFVILKVSKIIPFTKINIHDAAMILNNYHVTR